MSVDKDDDGMKALVEEIEERAQLTSLAWRVEAGGEADLGAQQVAHDLGVIAGIQAALGVLDARGMLDLDPEGVDG